MSELIILNERSLSKEEFEKEKEKLSTQKGIQLIEVSPNVYKTRLLG